MTAAAGSLSRLAIILGALSAFGPLSIDMYLLPGDLARSPRERSAGAAHARDVLRRAGVRAGPLHLVVTALAGVLLFAAAWSGAGGLPGLLLPLFVYISSLGFVLPNVVAAALAPQGRNAGSASALLGTVQFGAGAVVGMLLGALGNGTAVPMAGLIAACGLSALAVHRLAA